MSSFFYQESQKRKGYKGRRSGVPSRRAWAARLAAAMCVASLLGSSCSGVYLGVDGPDVIGREAAVSKINDARLAKIAVCGVTEANAGFLYTQYSANPRRILDGAYYTTKDIDSCVRTILLGSCQGAVLPCGLSPKDITEGSLLQGGI